MKILNFGSLNIDLYYQVERFTAAGETVDSRSFEKNIGGKGLNQSVALARAGARVYHAGCVGEDGNFLLSFLQQSGVDTHLIQALPVPSGNAVIQIDSSGQNCILLYGGANRQVTSAQIDKTLACFGRGDMILLQNEINRVDEIMEKAHRKGMIIVFNPSPFAGTLELPLELVDWFIMNQHESAQVAGVSTQEEIMEVLTQRFPQARFVMTLGSNGSLYFHKKERHFQGTYPVEIVDTTGAGDTFTGYFFASIAAGNPVADAMELAAKAAAMAISRMGAAPSIPTWQELKTAVF